MNKIVMWCKKFNLHFEEQKLNSGYSRIAIECTNSEFSAIYNAIHKVAARKGWTIDRHPVLPIIHVYKAAEHEEMRLLNDQREELINVFCTEYRKNQDGNKAKQVQYIYALHHGYLKAFESIYNR